MPAMTKLVALIISALALAGCSGARAAAPTELRRFEFMREKMGGPFMIVLYAADQPSADRAAAAGFARVDQLNAVLSDYDPNSDISRLSQRTLDGPMAEPVQVSDDLWRVLERAADIAKETGGAFDVTIGPFVRLWRRSRDLKELPTPERIGQARASVGYEKMRLVPRKHTVQLLAPRMRLDVGGLAIGYVTDQARDAVTTAGAPRVLVDGGGEVSVGDPPPGRDGWRVAIQSLKSPEEVTGQYVLLRNACVTSSGDTRRFVEIGGKRYSHILDPGTGLGLTRRIGATVISPDGMTADALDTAVCVLGPEKGVELIEHTPGAAGRITTIEGDRVNVYESKRFRQLLARQGAGETMAGAAPAMQE
jgi:thiamine biosynthesis lipoprotein